MKRFLILAFFFLFFFCSQGHFLRAIALENLGNHRECLRSFLKAYELDKAHPTQIVLSIIQAVGCICQMSESEELAIADQGEVSLVKWNWFRLTFIWFLLRLFNMINSHCSL